MTAPWVGEETDEYRAVCVYSDGPGQPHCKEPATLHVAVEDLGYGAGGDPGMTYRLYLCPVDEPLVDPNPDCPQHELHTPQPRGYVNWHEWAVSMNYKGHKQSRCPGLLNVGYDKTEASEIAESEAVQQFGERPGKAP